MMPLQPYEKDYHTQMDITFEMNRHQRVVARNGYTILDFISDIGGMQGIMMLFFAIFCSMWNWNQLDNYMVSKLYKVMTDEGARRVKTNFAKYSIPVPT